MSIAFQPAHFNQQVTILNDRKFVLYGEPIEGNKPGRLPTMHIELFRNYPRLFVLLNNGKQKEEARIELALDLPTLSAIIVALEDAIRSKSECCQLFAVKRQAFDKATNKPKEPYVYAMIAVGKNTDGVEFIGVQRGSQGSKNFMRVNFFFTAPEFHPIIDRATMQPASRQQVSNLMARGYVNLMKTLVPIINASTWQYSLTAEAKYQEKRAKQNGGNSGYQGGYQGGYQNNNAPANNTGYQAETLAPSNSAPEPSFGNDDDIPW